MKLGRLLVGRNSGRELTEVRVYRGQPDSTRDPKGYGANLRQCAAWERAGATVITRPLRYPAGWPSERAVEKGIDVASWSAPGVHARRLSIKRTRVWCHWLGPDDYKQVADQTNYTA
jgi:hypothetical protein